MQGDLSSQWTTDCAEEMMLPRFQDSIRTPQDSADMEVIAVDEKVIASQKQKDTLNTFKNFSYKNKGTSRQTVT